MSDSCDTSFDGMDIDPPNINDADIINIKQNDKKNDKFEKSWKRFEDDASKRKKKGNINKGIKIKIKKDFAEKLFNSPCYYCGHENNDEYNGIDRKNYMKHYTEDNCLPCCDKCNYQKGSISLVPFILQCVNIAKNFGACINMVSVKCDNKLEKAATKISYYNALFKKNINRIIRDNDDLNKYKWDVTDEYLCNLFLQPCVYCGHIPKEHYPNGIDRIQIDIGYSNDNIVTCCGVCSKMKSTLLKRGKRWARKWHIESFIESCLNIAYNQGYIIGEKKIPSLQQILNQIKNKKDYMIDDYKNKWIDVKSIKLKANKNVHL